MARFDRYMLAQCLQLFGFFSLVLVFIYWVNQAVSLFDQLIADGQTAVVFLEFTALSLPNLIRIVLPVAAFAAVLYVTNRMSTDSEITVMQATGYSARRMSRPVIFFGLIAGVMMAILMHVLVPVSQERLGIRESEVRQNVTARLLREGMFTHPGAGSTLYIRNMTPEGELLDVFLADAIPDQKDQIFTAERAFLVKSDDGPKLVMLDGQSQTLDPQLNTLFLTTFDDAVIDIGSLVDPARTSRPSLRELPTALLLDPTPEALALTRRSAGEFAQELHERFAQPLFPLVAALLGFAVLMSAGFTRFGIWKQIVVALVLLVALKSLEGVAARQIIENPATWALAYLPSALGLLLAWAALLFADRNRRMSKPSIEATAT
ncbi:MAG: LPS export ABC transporter permease LptF [Pseudomonadota bacterium]